MFFVCFLPLFYIQFQFNLILVDIEVELHIDVQKNIKLLVGLFVSSVSICWTSCVRR